ncbi:MAG: N-acetylmuramoyl-L-alanine amidase [Acidimicrobiales bacterium]|nr:N-acetylmuramoyl-L-alanine amidase [Acidimicrobiales bacterium]
MVVLALVIGGVRLLRGGGDGALGAAAFSGVGAWIDVFDWSRTFGGDAVVEPDDVEAMADAGIQTLYVQGTRASEADVLEPERLEALLDRADEEGLASVVWYLPSLVDPAADLRKLEALAELDVDAIAVDIEARDVVDPAERSRRIVDLSRDLREALPDTAIGAVPVAPVLLEVVNTEWWPGFPWAELAPFYDVWLPMSYSTERRADSGFRDAERYTAENLLRLRANLDEPEAPVHPVGGLAEDLVVADVEGHVRAAEAADAVGVSLYDWRTAAPELIEPLEAIRRPD